MENDGTKGIASEQVDESDKERNLKEAEDGSEPEVPTKCRTEWQTIVPGGTVFQPGHEESGPINDGELRDLLKEKRAHAGRIREPRRKERTHKAGQDQQEKGHGQVQGEAPARAKAMLAKENAVGV